MRSDETGLISRRTLLLGAASGVGLGIVGFALGVPTSRHELQRLVRPVPEPPYTVPLSPGGSEIEGSIASKAMGRVIGWSIAYPAGSRPGSRLPVLLVLHGRANDHRDALGGHALGAFLTAAVEAGSPSFAVVAADGGDHSYRHQRSSGEDPQAMIVDELLPMLESRGLRTDRVGLGGWLMGGYGALLLAEVLGAARVAVVAVDSPALWTRSSDTAPGAFDGRDDFNAHDVIARHGRLAGIPVRVACGTSDPFLPGVKAFLAKMPEVQSDLSPGGHDIAFWQHAAPAQLAFAGQHLALA